MCSEILLGTYYITHVVWQINQEELGWGEGRQGREMGGETLPFQQLEFPSLL